MDVWRQVLSNVCHDHGTFESTFDLNRMTSAEMEHAAISPYHFATLLEKRAVVPLATRLLHLRHRSLVDIHLVPGGRFLLTLGRDMTIDLWDLGYNPGSLIRYLPIATLTPQPGYLDRGIASIQPNEKETSSFYLFLRDIDSNRNYSVSIIAVYPLSPTSAFRAFRKKDLTTLAAESLSISVNLCVFPYDLGYVIWDYVSDLSTVWVESETPVDSQLFITISRDCVITYDENNFYTWDVSDLQPSIARQAEGDPPVLSPAFRFRRAHMESESEVIVYVTRNGWPNGRAIDVNSMFITGSEDFLDVYVVEKFRGQSSGVSLVIPRLKATTMLPKETRNYDMPPGRFANNTFVQPYQLLYSGNIQVAVLDSTKPDSLSTMELCTEASDGVFSFCPMSGRLCVLDVNQANIRVIDFVVPTVA
ncbi:hypothetical protein H0H93_006812 [Arthromyces matolae]|nr:hypothetical protein H0H93_006812 [Arthromyces matolae]